MLTNLMHIGSKFRVIDLILSTVVAFHFFLDGPFPHGNWSSTRTRVFTAQYWAVFYEILTQGRGLMCEDPTFSTFFFFCDELLATKHFRKVFFGTQS